MTEFVTASNESDLSKTDSRMRKAIDGMRRVVADSQQVITLESDVSAVPVVAAGSFETRRVEWAEDGARLQVAVRELLAADGDPVGELLQKVQEYEANNPQ